MQFVLAQSDTEVPAPPTEDATTDAATGDGATEAAAGSEAAASGEESNAFIESVSETDYTDPGQVLELVHTWALPAVSVVIILIVAYVLSKWVERLIVGAMTRAKAEATISSFMGKLAKWVILIVGFMMCLGRFGVPVASAAAVLAAAGFAVGLALQGTLSNFSAGVMLMLFRPFKVGDVVKVNGEFGKINAVDIFNTEMDTFDNRRVILPNSSVFGSTIENVSFHGERRVDVAVGVEYSADIDKTREVLEGALKTIEGVIDGEGRGTQVVLGDLGDSSVNWTCRVWIPASEFWPTKEAVTRAVKMALDEAGIGIPFPQMDVHLDKLD